MRSARASGCRRQAAIASALPARMPACGPPSSLSPREADEVAAVAQRLARSRLAGQLGGLEQRARADIEDERERRIVGELRQLAHLHLSREAERRGSSRGGRRARRRSPPRRHGCSRRRACGWWCRPRAAAHRRSHDLGDAEAVADLDELSARDDDLAPAGERGEREHERRSAVVDADRRLGAGQLADERGHVILARAARTRGEVELEVRIARGHGLHVRQGRLRERRPPEVRVQDDSRGVQHRAQRRLERGAHAPAQLGCERCGRCLLAAGTPLGQRGARLAHAERVRRVARRLAHEDVHGWQGARHGRIVGRLRAGEAGANPRYTALRAGTAT